MSGSVVIVTRPDGARLHVEPHGDPANPPIVLIEGMGGDLPGWARTVPNLERELFVLAYDQRGNGWSEAPDTAQSMDTFVDDALAVLDAFEIDRAHVYGQSFGGMVAALLALEHPDRLRSLILAATHAGGASIVRAPAVSKEEAADVIFASEFVREHPEDVRALYAHGVPQAPAAGKRQWEATLGYAVIDRLPDLGVPTLVLHGDQDRVIPVDNGRALASAIPNAELVILEGAGHVYHWEQPDTSDAAVLDFIRRH